MRSASGATPTTSCGGATRPRARADRERGLTCAELQERTRRLQETNAQLQSSLREKDILLKEVHHRVRNNLQVLCSLLSLQTRRSAGPQLVAALNESQDRLRAMALIDERLYASGDLARLDFPAYARQLAPDLLQAHGSGARARSAEA